jgi:hypothetical protein
MAQSLARIHGHPKVSGAAECRKSRWDFETSPARRRQCSMTQEPGHCGVHPRRYKKRLQFQAVNRPPNPLNSTSFKLWLPFVHEAGSHQDLRSRFFSRT